NIGELTADRQDRVEVLTRVGERQSELAPADSSELCLRQAHQLAAAEPHVTLGDPPGRAQPAGDRAENDRFSAARLAADAGGPASRLPASPRRPSVSQSRRQNPTPASPRRDPRSPRWTTVSFSTSSSAATTISGSSGRERRANCRRTARRREP